MSETITVKPIYGWGWSGIPSAPAEPGPFQLAIEDRSPGAGRIESAVGVVRESGHVLDGLFVFLTTRHQEEHEPSGYTLTAFRDRPGLRPPVWEWRKEFDSQVVASGFATLNTRYSLVVSLWIRPGQEAAFEDFEHRAARRMAKHGGRIDAAVRTAPNGVATGPEEATAFEVHIVSFPDKAAADAYANDPDTLAAREARAGIISLTMVVPGRAAGPY